MNKLIAAMAVVIIFLALGLRYSREEIDGLEAALRAKPRVETRTVQGPVKIVTKYLKAEDRIVEKKIECPGGVEQTVSVECDDQLVETTEDRGEVVTESDSTPAAVECPSVPRRIVSAGYGMDGAIDALGGFTVFGKYDLQGGLSLSAGKITPKLQLSYRF